MCIELQLSKQYQISVTDQLSIIMDIALLTIEAIKCTYINTLTKTNIFERISISNLLSGIKKEL